MPAAPEAFSQKIIAQKYKKSIMARLELSGGLSVGKGLGMMKNQEQLPKKQRAPEELHPLASPMLPVQGLLVLSLLLLPSQESLFKGHSTCNGWIREL